MNLIATSPCCLVWLQDIGFPPESYVELKVSLLVDVVPQQDNRSMSGVSNASKECKKANDGAAFSKAALYTLRLDTGRLFLRLAGVNK